MIKEASIYFKVTNFRNPPYEVNVTNDHCDLSDLVVWVDWVPKRKEVILEQVITKENLFCSSSKSVLLFMSY